MFETTEWIQWLTRLSRNDDKKQAQAVRHRYQSAHMVQFHRDEFLPRAIATIQTLFKALLYKSMTGACNLGLIGSTS